MKFSRLLDESKREASLSNFDFSTEVIYGTSSLSPLYDSLRSEGAVVKELDLSTANYLVDGTIVVTNNVEIGSISQARLDQLKDWVMAGGSILIGNDLTSNAIAVNEMIFEDTGTRVRGGLLTSELITDIEEHPITEGVEEIKLFQIWKYIEAGPTGQVLARMESNLPYAVENRLGSGKIVVVAEQIFLRFFTGEGFDNIQFGKNIIAYLGRKWASAKNERGRIQPGVKAFVEITLDATGYKEGNYEGNIVINSNDSLNMNPSMTVKLQICDECDDLNVSPELGAAGDTVFITSFLKDVSKANFVKFRDDSVEFGVVDSLTLFAVVPDENGTGTFKANIDGANFRTNSFKIVVKELDLEPASGAPGDTISIISTTVDLRNTKRINFGFERIPFWVIDSTRLEFVVKPGQIFKDGKFTVKVGGMDYRTVRFNRLPKEPEPSLIKQVRSNCIDNEAGVELIFQRGTGNGYLVVVKDVSNPLDFLPEDALIYPRGIDSATNNIIYPGDDDIFREFISDLAVDETYKFSLYTYMETNRGRNYNLDSSSAYYTVEGIPETQVVSPRLREVGLTSARISWTKGSGDKTLVILRESQFEDPIDPMLCTRYDADTVFQVGEMTGTNSWVVYNGTRNQTGISGLKQNTIYTARFYTFNKTSSGPAYNLTPRRLIIRTPFQLSGIDVYPNPFSGSAIIELQDAPDGGTLTEYMLYDLSGQIVQRKQYSTASDFTIDGNLKRGMYILKVYQNGKVYEKMVVKE